MAQDDSKRKATSSQGSVGSRPLNGSVTQPSSSNGPVTGRERRERHQRHKTARIVGIVAGVLLVLVLLLVLVYVILYNSDVFEITTIETEATEHVSLEDIGNLLDIEEGTTLLNVDTDAIEESLKQDSWVASVSFEYVWPNTLRITITEQEVFALVVLSTGSIGWYLGDAGIWIEPITFTVDEDQTVDDAALEVAQEEGVLLITDVPSTVSPEAGAEASEEIFEAVYTFCDGFSSDFASQIVCYYAPSEDSISCVLDSGVEILLGSATDIDEKEAIAEELLEEYPGEITYINVRSPTRSGTSFRRIDSDNIEAGDGTTSTSDEDDTSTDAETDEETSSEDSSE